MTMQEPSKLEPLEAAADDSGSGSTPSGHLVEPSSALAGASTKKSKPKTKGKGKGKKLSKTKVKVTQPSVMTDKQIEEEVIEAIKTVYDPEIPVNVYDLGLIYGIQVNPDRTVVISMTLTTPNCPAAGFLPGQVEMRVRHVPSVEDARVDITFEPPFTPDMMSDEAKLELGFL